MPTRKKSEAAALDQLRALGRTPGAVPGAAGASPQKVHGRYATATLGSVVLHLFDWSVIYEVETFDATAHGEIWKTFVVGDQSWTARASGYFKASDASYLAAAKAAADPTAVLFTGYKSMSPVNAQRVWAGNCIIIRGTFNVPMGMVTQEFELQGTGVPAFGPT